MQILENSILETSVLTISLAEALNGQYLGRGRQFTKALWLVLLASQVWVWTASGRELLCLVSFCAFSMSYSKWSCWHIAQDVQNQAGGWGLVVCDGCVSVCYVYIHVCAVCEVFVHVMCMHVCCVFICVYYVWYMLCMYVMCMCALSMCVHACVGRVCMHICEHTLHLFVYQLKGFFKSVLFFLRYVLCR